MGNSRSVILSPYRVTYYMDRILEDNLVALYTNRGCIVPDRDYANNPQAGREQKFILMQCGCKKPIKDRNQYGYSFCTSNFNKKGKVDIEGVQEAIKQAGGLNYVISKSNNIDFKGADDYWPIAEAAAKQKLEEELAMFRKKRAEDEIAKNNKAEVEEAAKYRSRKLEIPNASTANPAPLKATQETASTAKQTQCEHVDPVSEAYAKRGIISEVGEECLRSRGQRTNSGDRLACKMGNGLLLVYYFQRGEDCSFQLIENNSWTGASIAVREYRNLSELMSSHYR